MHSEITARCQHTVRKISKHALAWRTERVRDACRHRNWAARPQATDRGNGTLPYVELELELDWHVKTTGTILALPNNI